MSIAISLRSEFIKSKRTAAIYVALLAAAVIPIIFILDAGLDGISPQNRDIFFNKMFAEGFRMIGFLIFPLFIVLISTLMPQLEYKNNAWKQVLASPQPKLSLFLAKFMILHAFIFLFLVSSLLFLLLCAVVIHFIQPSIHLLQQSLDVFAILDNVVIVYIVLLALGTIQFWLGLMCKNFIVPIAIGISLWIIGTVLVIQFESGFAMYFPYSFHVYNTFPQFKGDMSVIKLASLIYSVLFLGLGYFHFSRKG